MWAPKKMRTPIRLEGAAYMRRVEPDETTLDVGLVTRHGIPEIGILLTPFRNKRPSANDAEGLLFAHPACAGGDA